nr:MAG TPA: hypothetical protein [Herelleviridae sp.]
MMITMKNKIVIIKRGCVKRHTLFLFQKEWRQKERMAYCPCTES